MKAPFPWFGGKARVADIVWSRFGDVHHYVEPFAGSLGVLLARPAHHKRRAETINDLDRMVCNFWRALKCAPGAVAEYASDPVNESDLFARHMWLVTEGAALIGSLEADPDHYDAKVAGWWVWGICSWIGRGWCSGGGPWMSDGKRPHLGNIGRGVNRQRPHLGNIGRGVNRNLPHLGNIGQGVNRKLPHRGDAGRGVRIESYLRHLADRLEDVRVVCGDWSRVVTAGALSYSRPAETGVFLDPPYLYEVDGEFSRTGQLYNCDGAVVANDVRRRAEELAGEGYRVALCGYEGEHSLAGWEEVRYSANRAYGTRNSVTLNSANRHREVVWFSPACAMSSASLFD